LEAWNAYEEICQGDNETVDDFARRLAVLEEAVGAEDDKVNAGKLYAKLTTYLRMEIRHPLRLLLPSDKAPDDMATDMTAGVARTASKTVT